MSADVVSLHDYAHHIAPPGVPEPFDFLEGDALQEWRRVAPHLAGRGLLTALTAGALAVYCCDVDHLGALRRELARRPGSVQASRAVRRAVATVKRQCAEWATPWDALGYRMRIPKER